MKVLIAYDGSAQADNAIADLSLAGLPADTQALVLSIAQPWMDYFGVLNDPFSGQVSPLAMEDAVAFDKLSRKRAAADGQRAAKALRARFPRWKITVRSREGSPAGEILSQAEAWKPSLIVLGSHGRTTLGRLLLGSVSQRVLHHAHTSVRIAHGKPASKPRPARILAAFDAGPDGNHALEVIAARKWPKSTRVKLFAAFDYRVIVENLEMSDGLAGKVRVRSLQTNWTEKQMAVAAKKLAAKGLKVEQESVYGEPRRELLKQAAAWRADCIFIGSRGLNALERFLIGSVSSSVASHAKCPVEIIRLPKAARRGGR